MPFRDSVKDFSPPWLANDTPASTGYAGGQGGRFMYTLGLMTDTNLEKLNQAMKAHMPGVGTPTALPLLGDDRLIERGLTESDEAYATRLSGAFDAWRSAGTDRGVLTQVLDYFLEQTPGGLIIQQNPYNLSPTTSAAITFKYYPQFTDTSGAPNYLYYINSYPSASVQLPNDPIPVVYPNIITLNNPVLGSAIPFPRWEWWLQISPGYLSWGINAGFVTISGGTPATVFFPGPHNLVEGQVISMYVETAVPGLLGNSQWVVHVVNDNTIELVGSVTTPGLYTDQIINTPTSNAWVEPSLPFGSTGATIGPSSTSCIGAQCAPTVGDDIRRIVALWKQAGSWCREILIPFDGVYDALTFQIGFEFFGSLLEAIQPDWSTLQQPTAAGWSYFPFEWTFLSIRNVYASVLHVAGVCNQSNSLGGWQPLCTAGSNPALANATTPGLSYAYTVSGGNTVVTLGTYPQAVSGQMQVVTQGSGPLEWMSQSPGTGPLF